MITYYQGCVLRESTIDAVYSDDTSLFLHAHVIDGLRHLDDKHVQMVITSPPYYGLRAYGTDPRIWGGDPNCGHVFVKEMLKPQSGGTGEKSAKQVTNTGSQESQQMISRGGCMICGAWLGEFGHEPTPQQYVANTVLIFRELRRVLKDDGVIFWNVSDSYAGSGKGPSSKNGLSKDHSHMQPVVGTSASKLAGIRPKSLMLIPERLAIALQDDGWIIRSRIAWMKKVPMPESVKDRPTSAWEHIWMITKQGKYYWDYDAVAVPAKEPDRVRFDVFGGANGHTVRHSVGGVSTGHKTRNLWNYWLVSPKPFKGAHFATFPPYIPETCIKAASRPDDIVLDPFCGSGTTNMVAKQLGRRSIGIDWNRDYILTHAIPRSMAA